MADTTNRRTGGRKTETDVRIVDNTAPGEGPVVIDANEARASEPVLTDEQALEKDTPPPADVPDDGHVDRNRIDPNHDGTPVSGDGDYVGRRNAPTARPGEAEFNAAVHTPSDDETTVDGIRYADVRNPRSEEERLEKREIELGADMDYAEHRRTYRTFMAATKYGTAILIALLIAMAVGFFIAGGFMGGIVVFIGAALASVWFLRSPRET